MIIKTFIIVLFLVINAVAFNLDKSLSEIEKLPKSERYKAMNELKLKIMKMRKEKRQKILKELLKKYISQDRLHSPDIP